MIPTISWFGLNNQECTETDRLHRASSFLSDTSFRLQRTNWIQRETWQREQPGFKQKKQTKTKVSYHLIHCEWYVLSFSSGISHLYLLTSIFPTLSHSWHSVMWLVWLWQHKSRFGFNFSTFFHHAVICILNFFLHMQTSCHSSLHLLN